MDAERKPYCLNSVGTVSHPYQLGNGKKSPQIQVPRSQNYLAFTSLSTNILLLSEISSRMSSCIYLSCLFGLFQFVTSLGSLLVFHGLDTSEEYWPGIL